MTDTPRRAGFDSSDFDSADFETEDFATEDSKTGDSESDADDVPVRCERCGRPFEREEWLALHLGHAHPGDLSDEEIDRFREAHADEESALDRFRLLALGALVLLYFGLLLVYAFLAL